MKNAPGAAVHVRWRSPSGNPSKSTNSAPSGAGTVTVASSRSNVCAKALISRAGLPAIIVLMSDEDKPKSFEETLRAIADEVTRGIQRVQQGDLEDIARTYGVDADRAKAFMDNAGDWLRAQADSFTAPPF